MMVLEQIQTQNWSLAIDDTELGTIVQNVADVDQCLRIILTTPKGTDPLRPDFACNLYAYLDLPVDQARPQIVRDATEAITRYEPRVKVLSILVDQVAIAQLRVAVTWQPRIAGLVPSSSFQTLVTIGV